MKEMFFDVFDIIAGVIEILYFLTMATIKVILILLTIPLKRIYEKIKK